MQNVKSYIRWTVKIGEKDGIYRYRRRPGTEKSFCINTWRIYDPNASQGTLANTDISRGIQERGRFMRWNLRPWAQGTEQFFRIITQGMRLSVDEREPLRPRSRFISMRKVFCPAPTATVIFRHAHQRPMNIPSEESIGFEGHPWYIARYFVHCSRLEVTLDFPCAHRSKPVSIILPRANTWFIYIYIYIPSYADSRYEIRNHGLIKSMKKFVDIWWMVHAWNACQIHFSTTP